MSESGRAKGTDARISLSPGLAESSRQDRAWRLSFLVLLAASGAALLPFIFRGFATSDSIRYALGLRSISTGSLHEIRHAFNGEMSFGYYLLLDGLARIVGGAGDPSGLMNAINASCAFLLMGLLFLLFARLLANPGGALSACLAVLLSPGVWLLSHYGHPALPALTAFAGSLLILDHIIAGPVHRSRLLWFLFILLTATTLLLRFDMLLAFGAYPGLLYHRHALSRATLVRTVAALAAALLIVGGLRVPVLGYLVNPAGGTVAYHLSGRLTSASLLRTVVKNTALWVVSANALVVALALAGLMRRDVRSRFGLLLVLWVAPWAVFLPFHGMDVSRIAVPTSPILALVAVAWVSSSFKRAASVALIATLALAQLVSVAVYPVLVRAYDFQREIDGHVLAGVPLGFPPVDQIYRQRAVTAEDRIAREVAQERSSDVLIVGRSGLMNYRFRVETSREVTASGKAIHNGVVLDSIATPQNRFYILDLDTNPSGVPLITRALAYLGERPVKFHLMPFWREHPTSGARLFLDSGELQAILERESTRVR